MKWYEDSQLVAKVIQAKYQFYYTYDRIAELIEDAGYHTSKKQIGEQISKWGLKREERLFFGDFTEERAAKHVKRILNLHKVKVKPAKKKKSHIKKHIMCSDLHLPFINYELFNHMLQNKADEITINGDIFDMYSVSRFIPYRTDMTLSKELNIGLQFIKIISETYPQVNVTIGNHFWRIYKEAMKKEGKIRELVRAGLLKHKPEEVIFEGFPNVRIANQQIKSSDQTVCFFDVLGKDFLYGHFEKASKIAAKPVIQAYETMRAWRDAFSFNMDNIHFFAQAHTHKLLHLFYEMNNVELFETGCLCAIQEYTMQPSMSYQPLNWGYLTFTQEDGYTDPRSIRLIGWKKGLTGTG